MAADSSVALTGSDLLQAIVEQAPDAIIFADRQGTIRIWNARAEALFGYAASEAIGKSLDLVIPEHLRAAHWRGYERAIQTGQTRLNGTAIVTRARHKDGSKLYVELAFGLLRDGQERVVGALATGRVALKPPSDGVSR